MATSYLSTMLLSTDNTYVNLILPIDCSPIIDKTEWIWHPHYNDAFPKKQVNNDSDSDYFSYSFRLHARLFGTPKTNNNSIDFRSCFRHSDLFTESFLEQLLSLKLD